MGRFSSMSMRVFLSHSKDDPRLRFFERACSSAGVELGEMELETPEFPPWRSIRREIARSEILFVSLSEPLMRIDYRHTQNWIDYEVGLACQRELQVWVFEPTETPIDFPIPYCTHCVRLNYDDVENAKWLKLELENLSAHHARRFGLGAFPKTRYDGNPAVQCPNERCGLEFFQLNRTGDFFCPSCRKSLRWETESPS
jgi:hypothetical protein